MTYTMKVRKFWEVCLITKMNFEYDKSNAKSTLMAFMRNMNAWEVEFYAVKIENFSKGVHGLDIYSDYVKWLEDILREFSAEGKINWGRLNDMGCIWPATYDVDRDSILLISEDEKNSTIEVKPGPGYYNYSKFYLKKSKGVWKIQKVEMLTHDDKWSRVPL